MSERVLIALQDDCLDKLQSEAAFATVNLVSQRKFLTSSMAELSSCWLTARGNKQGTAIIVGMPYIEDDLQQTGVSDATVAIPFYVFEQPDLAQSTGGPQLHAEELAITLRKLMRGFVFDGVCSLFTEGRSIVPAEPPADNTDVVCYEVTLKGRLRMPAESRVAVPTIAEAALTVTLTNQTSGATIYYTTDGSFPGAGNSAAHVYSTPFTVTSGTVVRFAAYKTGLSGSHVVQRTIT